MSPMEELTETIIKDKVKEFVINNFLLGNAKNLNDDDSFIEKGIIDSTGVLELVSFIEEAFRIKIEDEELVPDNLDSLNKATSYVKRKIPNAG